MANEVEEKKDPTKAQAPAEEMSLADFDRAIAADDPEFFELVKDISGPGAAGDLNLDMIDLDQLLAEQQARSLRFRLRRLRRHARNFIVGISTTLLHFLKNEVPILAKKGAVGAQQKIAKVGEATRQFGFKPLRFKISVLVFVLLCVAVMVALYLLLTRNFLTAEDRLFTQSMSELAEQTWDFEADEQEPFYDSARTAQNILSIPRLVVNIRRSENSGPNPMFAAEIYLEGNSPDVVVEIKDREVEFRDHLMRAIEEFNYDDLDSVPGKNRLLDRLAREANQMTTKGRVRKVYFKTILLKP